MRFLHFMLILGMLAACLIAPWTASAAPAKDVSIYKGEDPSENGMMLGGWGSGNAIKAKELILEGSWSIKITTQGLYSGGKIEFGQPVTLFSGGIDDTRYIQFGLFFNETQMVNPAPGFEYAMSDVEPYRKPKANKVRFCSYQRLARRSKLWSLPEQSIRTTTGCEWQCRLQNSSRFPASLSFV